MAESEPALTPEELALLKASGAGELQEVQTLIARGVNVNARSKNSPPALGALIAATANTTSLVAHNGKLVPEGQKLWEQKDQLLQTVQALLLAGADPNGTRDQSLLHLLARRVPDDVRIPIARLLLEKGANPDAVNRSGDSPLLIAAFYKSSQFARQLLEFPVEINRLAVRGTALDVVEDSIRVAKRDLASDRSDEFRNQLQTELQDLESLHELLKSRGAKHKSELDIPATKPKAQARHVASDFLQLVNTGEAEWAMLAVKAPFGAVSDAYLSWSKSNTRQRNVPLRAAGDNEDIPPVVAVVKVKDSPWTFILCTIFYVREADLKHVAAAARELSESLKTRALTYVGTEETDHGNCELFEYGKSIAKAGGKKAITLLTTEDVAVPAFYPAHHDKKAWVAVEKTSKDRIERADLIARKEPRPKKE